MTYRCLNLTPAGGSPKSQGKRHPLGYPISEGAETMIRNPCIYCGAQTLIFRNDKTSKSLEMNPHTEEQHRMIPLTRNKPIGKFVSPITYHITLFCKKLAFDLRTAKG